MKHQLSSIEDDIIPELPAVVCFDLPSTEESTMVADLWLQLGNCCAGGNIIFPWQQVNPSFQLLTAYLTGILVDKITANA